MAGGAGFPANGLVFILFEQCLLIEKIAYAGGPGCAYKKHQRHRFAYKSCPDHGFQSQWSIPCTQRVVCAMAYVERINVYCPFTIDPHHLRGSQEV